MHRSRARCLELQPINVLTGPLIGRAVQGQFARAIAEEGGTPGVFWAGGERIRYQRKKPPKRLVLGFEGQEFGYELQIGLPSFGEQALNTLCTLDPRVKEEYIWVAETKPRVRLTMIEGETKLA